MLIGILEAETLPRSIADRFGSYGDMIERLLAAVDPRLTFRCYAADQQRLPASTGECDAYLITGSRFGAYDTEAWIAELQSFIRALDRQKRKCIGICFGHQLLAHTLGGTTERSDKGWGIGVANFAVKHQPAWMEPSRRSFSLLVSHQDQVVALPRQAVLIAGNDFCPNGAFQIGEHILSFQGHPEFSGEYARYLMEKRRKAIGEQRVDRGVASLQCPTDEMAIAAGISRFLHQ